MRPLIEIEIEASNSHWVSLFSQCVGHFITQLDANRVISAASGVA